MLVGSLCVVGLSLRLWSIVFGRGDDQVKVQLLNKMQDILDMKSPPIANDSACDSDSDDADAPQMMNLNHHSAEVEFDHLGYKKTKYHPTFLSDKPTSLKGTRAEAQAQTVTVGHITSTPGSNLPNTKNPCRLC